MKTENNLKFEPEKLSLWDRFFNRQRKIFLEEGKERWFEYRDGLSLETYKIPFVRYFVKYAIVDRITGSVTIRKEYSN